MDMIFGDAPAGTALPISAVTPISHDVALTHLICLAKRQECLIQRNRGITFFGAFVAAGLAIWAFSPKCSK